MKSPDTKVKLRFERVLFPNIELPHKRLPIHDNFYSG